MIAVNLSLSTQNIPNTFLFPCPFVRLAGNVGFNFVFTSGEPTKVIAQRNPVMAFDSSCCMKRRVAGLSQ